MSDEILAEIKSAFEELKSANERQLVEVEKGNTARADELATQIKRINADIDTKQAELEKSVSEANSRLESLEVKLATPGAGSRDEVLELKQRHVDAFVKWVRNPNGDTERAALKNVESELRQKAVDTTVATSGGNGVPEILAARIEQKLLDISPFRKHVLVEQSSSSDYKKIVDTRGDTSGWVGETGTRSETSTPTVQQVAPTFGTLYAYPKATEESLQDIFWNVEEWLVDSIASRFAKAEGDAIVTGSGTNQPTGFLGGTPESADDENASPVRTFGEIQYVATGVAGDWAASNKADKLLELMYKLKAGYRVNAAWSMNKALLSEVRQFKDSNGQYLWQPAVAAGQPSTLWGFPIIEAEAMPDKATNSFSVAFGDFRAGYVLVDLVGMRMTRDEITTPGYVKFYARKREGGIVYNDDAIKVLKFGTA